MNFLEQIARYYCAKVERQEINLGQYTFVLPNKRSGMYLRKFLKKHSTGIAFQPKITTITAFIQEWCDTQMGEPLELLYILYKAYRRVKDQDQGRGETLDFDAFVHWGLILLNDFNDIDAYMVDADELFKNIIDEREIQSTFLTPAQCQAARALGLSLEQAEKEARDFWIHTKGEGNAKQQFRHRWEMLGPIYHEFQKLLAEQGLAYSGQQSLQAFHRLKSMGQEDFLGRKFAFIGFNVLGTARYLIFQHLRDQGIADFFWDNAFIPLSDTVPQMALQGNNAGDLVANLSRELPAPADFQIELLLGYPEINIYPVPSNVAQAKIASNIIQDITNPSTVDTGVILPNPDLMVPLLYSLPNKVETINLAMRVPFSNTPFWTLMQSIISMHERSKVIRGELYYFHKDVLELLSHPYLTMISLEGCIKIKNEIVKSNYYNVPAREILDLLNNIDLPETLTDEEKATMRLRAQQLIPIFAPVANIKDIDPVHDYLSDLISTLTSFLGSSALREPQPETPDNQGSSALREPLPETSQSAAAHGARCSTPYELTVLEAYAKHIDTIFDLAKKHGITMGQNTYFTLLRRLLSHEYFKISGEPLQGMQIMGLEDSRVLDFDNLIILSLNERIFPKRNFEPSYIPPALRLAYGMPNGDTQDQSMAYHFYRLISRVKRLHLIYDSRTPDLSSGEMSRYITQIEMLLPKEAMTIHDMQLGLSMGERRPLCVEKTDKVMGELSKFLAGQGAYNFSASALKKYISCPLRFYLEKVKGLTLEEFDPEYMDASSYGTIMHELAQKFYDQIKARFPKQFVSTDTLKEIVSNPGLEPWLIEQARIIMNKVYYNMKYHPTQPDQFFPGEGRVLSNLMAQYMIKLLEHESQDEDFKYLVSEYKGPQKQYAWQPGGDKSPKINFTLAIDRIDELPREAKTLRLIDYKTGTDDSSASNLESLIKNPDKGAIFQLFTYALAYHDLIDKESQLQPRIYSFTLLGNKGLPKISINRENIESLSLPYNPEKKSEKKSKKKSPQEAPANLKSYLEAFRDLFVGLIEEIYDPKVPFKQTEDDKRCRYCPFLQMCGRQRPDSD